MSVLNNEKTYVTLLTLCVKYGGRRVTVAKKNILSLIGLDFEGKKMINVLSVTSTFKIITRFKLFCNKSHY